MRARFHKPDLLNCSENELKFLSPSQMFFSMGKEYEVHAVSVYDGTTFLLLVDDLETPAFHPRFAFETTDSSVPGDWICNVFSGGPIQLVLGPEFIAKDQEAYNAMVDQEMAPVNALWRRIHEPADPLRDK